MSKPSETPILDRIPSTEQAPEGALPSLMAVRNSQWSRRRIVGMAFGAFTATGLAALDLFPGARTRSAAAAVYTTVWTDGCHGYANASSVCTPSSAYYSSDNCTGTWHRDDGSSGTCYALNWTSLASTCDGRNAWRWSGGSTSALRRKCSDGRRYVSSCGSSPIDQFSICRTSF